MTRRSALAGFSAIAAAALVSLVWVRSRGPNFSGPLGPDHVDAAFASFDRLRWRELGRSYLMQYPDDRDVRGWIAGMVDGFGECCRDGEELVRAIVEKIAADFDAGETVSIEGWMLSRTEARLAALVVLSTPTASRRPRFRESSDGGGFTTLHTSWPPWLRGAPAGVRSAPGGRDSKTF